MHAVHVKGHLHRVAHAGARARIERARELGVLRHEIDNDLVTQQLGHVDLGLYQRALDAGRRVLGVVRVLGPDAKDDVAAQVRAYDNVDGRIVARLWDVEWTAVRVDGSWRLDNATAEQLDSWELAYYP